MWKACVSRVLVTAFERRAARTLALCRHRLEEHVVNEGGYE
jgi:hypothetical protein